MYSPCEMCKSRFNKEYSEECDAKCDYAVLAKIKNDIISVLQDTRYSDDECLEEIIKIVGIHVKEE